MKKEEIRQKAKEMLSNMTLEEKTTLLAGKDFWNCNGVERLGLNSQMLTDGPHGLRKQAGEADHLGINNSVPATCFPAACATACSYDPDLIEEMGRALGEKCVSENVGVILGPGVNIKRNPLCGRNFEYFSEDPFVSGKMASGLIKGVQSCGIGTSLKHFAANNQENERMVSDSIVDERALREIYLTAFEIAVKEASPWTVMCSYNKLNGTYVNENKKLLTSILREEWGFDNLVVSDWGAVSDRINGVLAGMDLEMPGVDDANAKKLVNAVKEGKLSETDIDTCALRVVELLLKIQESGIQRKQMSFISASDKDHNELARKIASQSAVLLKNDNKILPLSKGKKICIIGEMAKKPRYQGAGSSKINPAFLDNAYDAICNMGEQPLYAPGYTLGKDNADTTKLQEAVELAGKADVVVVFAGLPDEYESEGFDRKKMTMPDSHVALIEAVANKNKNTIVVLQCGSPVEMPWKDKVAGILLMYLAGQAGGGATADLLYGTVNPSGKLAETWPLKLTDTPNANNYPGGNKQSVYLESIFVGYRYYDKIEREVAYPFGYGLSYTDFAYRKLDVQKISEKSAKVTVTVENTGSVAGAEIVQLYVGRENSVLIRAPKELKGFQKILLAPGESKEVVFQLDERAFSYYNPKAAKWCIEGGTYQILVGPSSIEIPLKDEVLLEGDNKEALLEENYRKLSSYQKVTGPLDHDLKQFELLLGHSIPPAGHIPGTPFTTSSTLDDMKDTFIGKQMAKKMKSSMQGMLKDNTDEGMATMVDAMMLHSPIRFIRMAGGVSDSMLEGIVDMANKHYIRGIKKMKKK